jgi:hypothetical protein
LICLGHLEPVSFGRLSLSPGPLSHSLNDDGPPDQAGLVTFNPKWRSAAAEAQKYSDIAADYNGEEKAV